MRRRRQGEVIQVVHPRVEPAGVRRVGESESFAVEVVAELVQQRMQQAAKGSHLPEHGGAHPDADALLLEVVVAKKLGVPALPDAPGPRSEHA